MSLELFVVAKTGLRPSDLICCVLLRRRRLSFVTSQTCRDSASGNFVRFADDHNRVKLGSPSAADGSDYINASYIVR